MSLYSRAALFYRAHRYRWKHDPAEIAFVRQQVRRGTVALDIGAHKGGYTYWLAEGVGPAGLVYAFEPQPKLARALRRGFPAPRVVVENAAVSDHEGTMRLHIPTEGRPSPGASLERSAATSGGHDLEVRVVAFDDYWNGRTTAQREISFVKCDVEGHELKVFRGAEKMLRRHHPVLLFECEQRHHGARPVAEVFAYLLGLGYAGWFFHGRRLVSVAEFNAAEHQRNPGGPGYCNNFVFMAGRASPP